MTHKQCHWVNFQKANDTLRLWQVIIFALIAIMVIPVQVSSMESSGLNKESSFLMEASERLENIQPASGVIVVTGRVYDTAGESLPGVTVAIKGTSLGTVTDNNGYYRLEVPAETVSIQFSFIGMKTIEEVIGGRSAINIVMEEESIGLDEIVVVGYGEQRKINMTGSVSTVSSQELNKVPLANVSEVLVGKAPGLFTMQSQGVPGNDFASLSIRGYGDPLILVDGIETSWTRLDPNEIESVSVLKDAAAAIYGSRAGNGVILITTKRGTIDKPTISYTSNFSFQDPTTVPEFVNSYKYAELLSEGQLNSNLPVTYTPEEIQKFKAGNDPDYINEDWYKATFRTWAPMLSHNLGVRGGTENIKYYMTVGYLDQSSIYKSGDLTFKRYNARSNIDAKISDRLSASIDLSFRNEDRLSPQTALGDIWHNLKTALPVYPANLPDPDMGAAYSGFLERSPNAQTERAKTGFIDDFQRYFTGKIGLKYDIPGIDGLEANAVLNYSINNKFYKVQDKPFNLYTYDYKNQEYVPRGTNGTNSLDETSSQYTQIYPMISLNYNKTFGDHSVQGLLLAEGIKTDYNFLSAGRVDLLSVEMPYLFAGSPDNLTNNGGATETGRVSSVGRANYAYKGKYLLEGTFRYDASHKFPEDTRWGFFPSVSAAWRLSEESFLKDNISWLDNLKIRASYSQSGNDNVEAFKYLTGYDIIRATTNVYVFGADVYRLIRSTGLPNPDITWLEMTSYNIGLDATLLRDLIGIEFDLFHRITDNIFGQPRGSYPSTFGATLPQVNLNSTEDKGFELTLNHRNRVNNDFNYKISGTVSYAREKYRRWSESPFEDPDEIRIYKLTGNYTNRWIGYMSDGIFMSQDEINNHLVDQDQAGNTTLKPGDIKYVDLNKDGIIDWRDQDEIGYGTFPDLYYMFNLEANYKAISVSALFQGASMHNVNISDVLRGPLQNLGNPFEFHYKYRWQPDPANPGNNINPNAKLPAMLGDGVGVSTNNNKTSDFWLKDGTYLRLKNINISYNLPKQFLRNIGIQDLSIYVAGSNLLTFSKMGIYKNTTDPESQGGTRIYPPVKTVSVGFNVTL